MPKIMTTIINFGCLVAQMRGRKVVSYAHHMNSHYFGNNLFIVF